MSTQIHFNQFQIEEILFGAMVQSREITNQAHGIKIELDRKGSDISGLKVFAKPVGAENITKVYFTLTQIEELLFMEMVKSKEIPHVAHSICLDFKTENEQITGVNVKTQKFEKKIKMK